MWLDGNNGHLLQQTTQLICKGNIDLIQYFMYCDKRLRKADNEILYSLVERVVCRGTFDTRHKADHVSFQIPALI